MRKKEIKGASKAQTIYEASDETILKMIKDMRRGLETLEEYGLVELNPKSEKYRLTGKCHEAIKDFLDFINAKACINEFFCKKDLELTHGEQLEFARRVIALHVLDKFGVCQFKKKDNFREMRLVESLSIFININVEWGKQNWKQSNGN